ncbi:MAG: pyrroline-5-carboxylate reductase [Thermoanaerobacteraceae bacterium]|nr:pyrroline-5-carboxylate reductase [Thermoanaerobacteraceae bacterium]
MKKKIGFIGCGNIAEAIIKGLLNAGFDTNDIIATNKEKIERLEYIKDRYGINVTRNKSEVVERSNILILAVKPKDVQDALKDINLEDRSLISVAAGITTAYIESQFDGRAKVIRAMPNTSSMVGESVTAICKGKFAGDDDLRYAYDIFSSIGEVAVLDEDDFDAVTGLSGSGPAYVYYMMEALVEAGVKNGLDEEVARGLARQTIFGAAVMLKETGEDPSQLRLKVTSPGGTTMAGIMALESSGFKETIYNAVYEASRRSKEMRKNIGA